MPDYVISSVCCYAVGEELPLLRGYAALAEDSLLLGDSAASLEAAADVGDVLEVSDLGQGWLRLELLDGNLLLSPEGALERWREALTEVTHLPVAEASAAEFAGEHQLSAELREALGVGSVPAPEVAEDPVAALERQRKERLQQQQQELEAAERQREEDRIALRERAEADKAALAAKQDAKMNKLAAAAELQEALRSQEDGQERPEWWEGEFEAGTDLYRMNTDHLLRVADNFRTKQTTAKDATQAGAPAPAAEAADVTTPETVGPDSSAPGGAAELSAPEAASGAGPGEESAETSQAEIPVSTVWVGPDATGTTEPAVSESVPRQVSEAIAVSTERTNSTVSRQTSKGRGSFARRKNSTGEVARKLSLQDQAAERTEWWGGEWKSGKETFVDAAPSAPGMDAGPSAPEVTAQQQSEPAPTPPGDGAPPSTLGVNIDQAGGLPCVVSSACRFARGDPLTLERGCAALTEENVWVGGSPDDLEIAAEFTDVLEVSDLG
eukprot:Hpha_TRINITY_DN15519_c2_g4::TRINITY_DN15519_c2_g4_i1::g.105043::m.105043